MDKQDTGYFILPCDFAAGAKAKSKNKKPLKNNATNSDKVLSSFCYNCQKVTKDLNVRESGNTRTATCSCKGLKKAYVNHS